MNEKEIKEIKAKLREYAKAYKRPLHGKLAILEPFKDELLDLEAKGVSKGEIAAELEACKVKVSKDTIQRFLRVVKQKKSSRSEESDPPKNAAESTGGADERKV
jgi:hypothetical protein